MQRQTRTTQIAGARVSVVADILGERLWMDTMSIRRVSSDDGRGARYRCSRCRRQAAGRPDPRRFDAEIKAFHQLDSQNTPPKGAVLFVGSSSIKRWPTADGFPKLTVINRGFGGFHIADVNHYFDQTVRSTPRTSSSFTRATTILEAGRAPIGSLRTTRPSSTRSWPLNLTRRSSLFRSSPAWRDGSCGRR